MNARFEDLDDRVTHLRVPPQAVDAEQAVIGGVLLVAEALHEVQDLLVEDDFYRREHQVIWRAVLAMVAKRQPVDVVTLGDWIEAQGQLELIGNGAYLIELATSTPSAANIRAYAEIVRDKALRRQLIQVGTDIVNDGFEGEGDSAEEVVAAAAAKVANLTARSARSGGLVLARSGLQAAWAEMEARYNGTSDLGLQLPWGNARRKIPGLEDTDLMVLAARPSMGKTAAALECAEHAASQGRNVAVFSMEMSRTQLIGRLMSRQARVPLSRMREKGGLSDSDWHELALARNYIATLPLAIDETGSLPMDALAARATRMHAKVDGGLGLIVVDYLQLITGSRGGKSQNRTEEVSEVSRGLKGLAKALRCPVIALSQLNRGLETRNDKRPMMADLRESGAIEQDADVIAFLYRDDYYTKDACGAPGIAELIVGKNRQGETGTAYLRHRLECSTFEDYHGPKPDYSNRVARQADDDDGGFDEPAPRRQRRGATAAAARQGDA